MPKWRKNCVIPEGMSRSAYFKQLSKQKLHDLYGDIKHLMNRFKSVYVVKQLDPTGQICKFVQRKWYPSIFKSGTVQFLQNALEVACDTPEYTNEIKKVISCLRDSEHGRSVILFTSLPTERVQRYLTFQDTEMFGGEGVVATKTIVLHKGPHYEITQSSKELWKHNPSLPGTVEDGVVVLSEDYEICREGVPLTRAQFKTLKLLGLRIPNSLRAVCCYNKLRGFEFIEEIPGCDEEQEHKKFLEDPFASTKAQRRAKKLAKKAGETSREPVESFTFVDDIEENI